MARIVCYSILSRIQKLSRMGCNQVDASSFPSSPRWIRSGASTRVAYISSHGAFVVAGATVAAMTGPIVQGKMVPTKKF